MKGIVCDWMLGCLLAAPQVDPNVPPILSPSDLQFRSILYQVYQQQDEQALIEALVTENLAPGAPSDRARYQLAQISTAFAINARSIALGAAAKMESEGLGAQDRIRLAVLLARDSHRHADWSRLEHELEQINTVRREIGDAAPLPAEIAAEINFMRAELATAQGDFGRAEAIIRDEIPERDSGRAFALFNLGVALRNSGIPTRAEQTFTTLASMRVYSEDALDLKQRALVALALLNQQRTASASAEAFLRQIPAQSRYHDQALVAYASLAMEHGDYEVAARIWSTLLQESTWSNAAKTAQLGYPICLENLGKPRVALNQYRLAEANFTQRLEQLRTLSARMEDVEWKRRLIHAFAKLPDDELSSDPTLQSWRDGLGHDDWFAWLTSAEVQRLLQDLRELERMITWLTAAAEPAANGATALAERRRTLATRASRLIADHEQRLSDGLATLVQNEAAIADRQLRLIRVGVARSTDRIADETPAAVEP